MVNTCACKYLILLDFFEPRLGTNDDPKNHLLVQFLVLLLLGGVASGGSLAKKNMKGRVPTKSMKGRINLFGENKSDINYRVIKR